MAGYATELVIKQSRHHRHMYRLGPELGRVTMTLQTVAVRERPGKLDLLGHVHEPVVYRHVAHALQLGQNRSKEAVIRVASVALIVENPAIVEVPRGQGGARWIVQIIHPWGHGVATGAKAHSLSPLKRQGEGRKSDQRWGNPEDEKQKEFLPELCHARQSIAHRYQVM
jgi:hypothetical protein